MGERARRILSAEGLDSSLAVERNDDGLAPFFAVRVMF